MNLASLKKYVLAKYGLKFVPVIAASQAMQVLTSPIDQSWFAILSKFQIKNAQVWALDIKCGDFAVTIRDLPGFSSAYRLQDKKWVGILLDNGHDLEIRQALNYAYKLAGNSTAAASYEQYLYVNDKQTGQYQEQKLDFKHYRLHHSTVNNQQQVPPAIAKMLASYDYSILPAKGRAKNFYQQALLMYWYTDDFAQQVPFNRSYPVYHDMTLAQLRSYFSWRSQLRQGKFVPGSLAYAYVYLYELLNNVEGNAEKSYQKLENFLHLYAGKYEEKLQHRLRRWLQDFVLYYNLSNRLDCFAGLKKLDRNYCILLEPEKYADEEVVHALFNLSSYHFLELVKAQKDFEKILANIWRQLAATSFFKQYIAFRQQRRIRLFTDAVFYVRDYSAHLLKIDSVRLYQGQGVDYLLQSLVAQKGQRSNVNLLLHECDRLLRQFWHLGHPLKARQLEAQYLVTIKKAILAEAHKIRAQKNKVEIDLSKLQNIRSDAAETRDALLVDEQEEEEQKPTELSPASAPLVSDSETETTGLTTTENYVLKAIMQQKSCQSYLQKRGLMLSLICEQINEKMLDIVGDSVIDFDEQGRPQIIADYIADVQSILKEQKHA